MTQKRAGVISLGCAKNRIDSEMLLGALRGAGYDIVAEQGLADIMFVNTCGFIEPAKQESINTIFEAARLKREGKLKLLFMTGCLVERYAEELFNELPEVDGFLGVSDYSKATTLISAAERGERLCFTGGGERFIRGERVLTTPKHTAYVRISEGCDNRCAYCAIPLIRGNYSSRPFGDIIDECERLADTGVKELTLIAQDTSRYGSDFPEKKLLLPELLKRVSGIGGIEWVRVLYCYPDSVTTELLDVIANTPKLAPYLDLPLQHINAELLRKMNRRGSPELIRKLIAQCRERGITLRTTMIVGFPGETDEMFSELLEFVEEVKFDRLGAFTYSPEENTAAASMPGQLAEEVKLARLDALMTLQRRISLEANAARIGETAKVLVEGRRGSKYIARSIREAPEADGVILIRSSAPLRIGGFSEARITGAKAYDLTGEVIT